jgi:MoaD family protein
MVVVVKFVGALRNVSGASQLKIDCVKGLVLKDLISEVVGKMPRLEKSLLDKQLEEPKSNALVLVNGREISVLGGLETALKDGDEIVFIPVVHGG